MINTQKIKARIMEVGSNQNACANAIHVAQSTFSQKINNVRPMTLEEAEALADFLKIPDPEFCTYFFSPCVA